MFKKKEVPVNNAEEDARAVMKVAERIAEQVKDKILQGTINITNEKIEALIHAEDNVIRLKRSITNLEKKISDLGMQEQELKSKRKLEDIETKALVKIRESQAQLELKATEIALKNDFKDLEIKLVEKFHKDLEGERVANQQRQDVFFDRILQCLPNVNVKLGQEEKKAEKEDAKKVS